VGYIQVYGVHPRWTAAAAGGVWQARLSLLLCASMHLHHAVPCQHCRLQAGMQMHAAGNPISHYCKAFSDTRDMQA
jgi:hypothetical protein